MKYKALLYTLIQYFATFINLIRGFLIASLLGPTLFGLWSFTTSLINYFRFSNFGISTFIYYRANLGDFKNQYLKYLYVSFFNLVLPFAVIYSIIYFIFLEEKNIDGILFYSFIFLFVIVLLQLYNVFLLKLKIEKLVLESSKYEIIYSLITFVFYIAFTYYFSLEGLFIAFLLSLILINLLLYKKLEHKRIRDIKLKSKKFKTFFYGGIVTIVPSFLYYVFIYIDLWLISTHFDFNLAGFFALYLTYLNLVIVAPSSISTYFYSILSKTIKNNFKKTFQLTIVNFFVALLVALLGYVILEFAISNYLQKYEKSIIYIEILFLSTPFLTIKNILGNYFIANKKTKKYNGLVCFLIILKVVLFYLYFNLEEYLNIVYYVNITFGILLVLLAVKIKGEISENNSLYANEK